MADYLHADVYDYGVTRLSNTENLYICSALPATFLEASSTYKLATKSTPTITGPTDRATGGGRQMTVGAIADGVVNTSGMGAYYALCDNSDSKLLAAGDLDPGSIQQLTAGNPFTLTAFNVGIPAPTT